MTFLTASLCLVPSTLSYLFDDLQTSQTARRSNQSILKEISPKFIGRTDTEAETPILWPSEARN